MPRAKQKLLSDTNYDFGDTFLALLLQCKFEESETTIDYRMFNYQDFM